MKFLRSRSSRQLRMAAFLCSFACLVIWFLPGSYYSNYLESNGTGVWVTSLFAFLPALVVLPLLSTAVTSWAVYRRNTNNAMVWTVMVSTVLQVIYLCFIKAFNLPHFAGENFIWLETFPLPLTLICAVCFLFASRNQDQEEQRC